MKKIYSKINPKKLLHIIVRKTDMEEGRIDVVSGEHFLQCALLNMGKGKTFKPHKHIIHNKTTDNFAIYAKTNNSNWFIIAKVQCHFIKHQPIYPFH